MEQDSGKTRKRWSDLTGNIAEGIERNVHKGATDDQEQAIGLLGSYLTSSDTSQVFILKGYAGTGKTTLVSAVSSFLGSANFRTVLLAPTGRAAKVLSAFASRQATTIHREIYLLRTNSDGTPYLSRRPNKRKTALFIVDEASMIPGRSVSDDGFRAPGDKSLLEDLLSYVSKGQDCKVVFIGDHAQLPPVGLIQSPALDPGYLRMVFGLESVVAELTEVVRQAEDSAILGNATSIRNQIRAKDFSLPVFNLSGPDIRQVSGYDLEEELHATIGADQESAVFITRSNRRANQFNHEIRRRILFREEELSAGDLMMVVKNNYYWLDDEDPVGFIANGDTLEIERIHGHEQRHGKRFANVTARLVDYPDHPSVEVKLLLDTIDSESPSLTLEQLRKFYQDVRDSYIFTGSKFEQTEAVRNDPYYNALQVKFAYAITCHKTQGGQWKHVFVEQGYIRGDHYDEELWRWLYTAVTRATDKLYLVNFRESFYKE